MEPKGKVINIWLIDTAIKLLTSGLRIISCIQINDPNENPETTLAII